MWIGRFGNLKIIGKREDIAIALLRVRHSSAVHLYAAEFVCRVRVLSEADARQQTSEYDQRQDP